MNNKRTTLLLLMFLAVVTLLAQNVTITGVVSDKASGETLIGAKVLQKGTNNGTITNFDGNFTISVPLHSVLEISYVGYNNQEVTVQSEAPLKIDLAANDKILDEVVVVGYGTQKVKDMTAPISSVKGEELTKQIASNPMSALQGKMSGVQIINSGAPGSGPSVKIRGVGSIGDYASPLYVVDGAFVDNIDFLSSGDIEDLTVLKDASAAAIYGVRAANGVVLVTTKKGKIDQSIISYEAYVGYQMPTNVMKLAGKDQYVELLNRANENTTDYIPKVASAYPASTDWYSELLRNALMHNHSLDFSGANEKTNYSFGLNYFYQDGIMKAKNDYNRFNFRARLDQKMNNWLSLGFNTVISNYKRNNPNNNAFFSAFINPPVYSIYNENSTAYPEKFDAPQNYGFGNQYGNPYATAFYNNNKEDGLKLIFSTFAEFNIIDKMLKFRTSYNLDFGGWKGQNYTPEFLVGGSQGVKQSSLDKSFYLSSKQIIDNLLTYTNLFGDHSLTWLFGQSTRIENFSKLSGSAQNVPGFDDQSIYLSTGSFRDRYATDEANRYHGLSFFTRGTYNYQDKYLATFTFRADGSSKYQQKWGYFPSIGLGWILTNEDFFKGKTPFDYLKFRASWGMLGNDNIPANSSVILGQTGAGSSAIFNDVLVDGQGAQTVLQRYLKWEVVNEFNVGFDFALIQNKLSGELDYYNRVTNNVVFYTPISAGAGTAELLSNNGKVQNQGFELGLNWNDKITDDLSYRIGWNVTTVFNKVLKLEGKEYIPGASVRGNFSTRTQVGYPIGAFWGYEIDKVYESEGEALRDPVSQAIKDKGFFKYKDQNGDDIIDDKDKVFLGSPIPWLMSGLDVGLNYKNFDFGLTLQGQLGNYILNAKRMNRDVFADANYDLDFYKNAWSVDHKSTKYPSPEAYNQAFTQQANSFFVENGSYIRIQNVQVGYNFAPTTWFKSLRVYLSAQRPFTYFGYKGFTPEVGGSPIANGVDTSVYPMQAIYTAGLKVNF